jgi:hypothetical protein
MHVYVSVCVCTVFLKKTPAYFVLAIRIGQCGQEDRPHSSGATQPKQGSSDVTHESTKVREPMRLRGYATKADRRQHSRP